jgi:tetratricopeptide (TPR) repeat protein
MTSKTNESILSGTSADPRGLKFIFDVRTERYRKSQTRNPEVLHYQNLALLFISELIDLNPNDKISLCNRGTLLISMGRIQDAIRDLDSALALDSDFALVYSNRATALTMIDQVDKALIDFDAALVIQPELEVALIGRGALFLGLGEFEKAARDFTVALERKPDEPEIRLLRAQARFALGKYLESAEDVDMVLTHYPNYVSALQQKGRLEAVNGSYLAALTQLNKAVELDPQNARTYLIRSDVHKIFGNKPECRNDLELAYKMDGTLGSFN